MAAQTRIRHGSFQERARRLVREMITRRAVRIACAAAQMIRVLVAASTADLRENVVLDSDSGAPAEIDLVASSGDGVAATNGSRYSSSDGWIAKTKPMIGILSAGTGNRDGHPMEECLEWLHGAHVMMYWTEQGSGAPPEHGLDVIAQSPEPTAYAWANTSSVYHYTTCKYVSNIAPANLVQGAQPPIGKKLHQGCPK